MAQARVPKPNISLFFLFLVTFVAAGSNILIHFFLYQHSYQTGRYHLLISASATIIILILIFLLFSYHRGLKKKIETHALTIDELVSKNDFFRLLSEQSSDMLHFIDNKRIIRYVNPVTTALLGYDTAEMIDQPALNFIHPDDREAVLNNMQKVTGGFSVDPHEIRLLKKNGDWLDIEAKGFPFDHNGKHKYIGAVLRDISNRKKKEKLLQLQDEWEQTFNSMTDYVSVHDKNFKILKVNNALCDFLQKKPEEILGKYCYQIFHDSKEPIAGCPHVKAIETKHAVTMEVNDPVIGVPLEVTCSPFFNEKNEFQGSVHIARNITDRKVNSVNGQSDKSHIPICASCKDIRDESDTWVSLEEYFQEHCRIMFTHCICKKCQKKLYPEFVGK